MRTMPRTYGTRRVSPRPRAGVRLPCATVPRRRAIVEPQIADRLGRMPATIKAYFCDPIGEKAGAVKVGHQWGVPRLLQH